MRNSFDRQTLFVFVFLLNLTDVSSVHGITGVVGSIAIGFLGEKSFNTDGRDGLFFGEHRGDLLGSQCLAVLVTGVWSGIWTIILLKSIDKLVGLKIEHDEELGLDEEEHGEQAYEWRNSIVGETLTEEQIHSIIRGSVNRHIQNERRRLTRNRTDSTSSSIRR